MSNWELEFLLHRGILPVSPRWPFFTAEIEGFLVCSMNALEKPNEMLLSKDGFQCCVNS